MGRKADSSSFWIQLRLKLITGAQINPLSLSQLAPGVHLSLEIPSVPPCSLACCAQSLQNVSQPFPHLFVLPARAVGLLTPQIEHGRSPLQCHPSPWPAERGSHRSVHLSCRGSSPAQRWSILSHGGSTDNREPGQTTRKQTGHTGVAAPHSTFVSKVSLLFRALRRATGNFARSALHSIYPSKGSRTVQTTRCPP